MNVSDLIKLLKACPADSKVEIVTENFNMETGETSTTTHEVRVFVDESHSAVFLSKDKLTSDITFTSLEEFLDNGMKEVKIMPSKTLFVQQ
jgi:hypothetical protein